MMWTGRRLTIAVAVGLAGYVVSLGLLPRLIQANPTTEVVSAALALGYNAPLAYSVALIWSLTVITAAAFWGRTASAVPEESPGCGRLVAWELLAVFALFFLAYFPLFLARYAPLTEDHGFITALFRMACGQVPFRDFEFLYGPAMIYSLWWWGQAFGVSVTSYFSFLAVQEAVQFTLLMAVLQLAIADRRRRYLVFLLLLPFLFDTLLGVNWSALRRLVAVFALLMAALRPFDLRMNLAVAVLIGLYATYSHEYAAAALFGIGLIYAALLFGPDRRRALVSGPIIALGALAVWAAGIFAMLGSDWPYYVETMKRVVSVMSQGHVSFSYYWTLNSLALFSLLVLACLAVGCGLTRLRHGPSMGDLFLIGALGFALVALKSGLTRADHWHLGAAFTPLFFAFLLPLGRRTVSVSLQARKAAVILIAIAGLSYLPGIYSSGKRYARAYIRGAEDMLRGVQLAEFRPGDFRGLSAEAEHSRPDAKLTAIGRYLADPARMDRPVLYYGTAWIVAPRIGACSDYFPLDALMYSELPDPGAEFLKRHTDAFVVMSKSDYRRVFDGEDEPEVAELAPIPRLGSWLTSVHFTQADLEARLLNEARDRTTGAYLRENYELDELTEPFGPEVLLRPKER
ncbi:hypothetical protein QKW60_12465 [Defluviimonas aestuarii]|uniref:hypothetical protein n=1 Tax=Albidovulum aestuarii TaxID=1130726 RepID=UPI002499D4D4|nr:hypothetical protein [Defluviimonas aestuarii]MDI3337224.1 hypothetical protein [Defluviimonas aestuarii]